MPGLQQDDVRLGLAARDEVSAARRIEPGEADSQLTGRGDRTIGITYRFRAQYVLQSLIVSG